MNDHPHSRYSLDKRLAGQLAPALNGVFQPIGKGVSRSYKIRLKLAADGQLFLQACLFITFRGKKKKKLRERKFAIQDTSFNLQLKP